MKFRYILAALLFVSAVLPQAASAQTTATPTITPASGVYNAAQTVTISDATPGAVIYYTTNDTAPTTKSAVYTGPFTISSASDDVKAIAQAPGYAVSAQGFNYYTIKYPIATPVASPAAGAYATIQTVTLTDATPGASIYYTLNGSYPSTSSTLYTGPITVTGSTLVEAIASAPNYVTTSDLVAQYTITAPAPTITPQSGVFQNSATVTITDPVPGATIYYTTDGSIPTTSSSKYTGTITVAPAQTSNEVYHAIAVATGYLQSPSSMAAFTVDEPAGVLAQATVAQVPTVSIPSNFMGLSTDFTEPPNVMGQASTGANAIFYRLLNNLTATNTGPMMLRIEGDDSTLAGIQADIEPLVELAQAVNINYALGVDLWYNNVTLAEQEASAWSAGIPNKLIVAFEIGNEPDVYPYNGARPSSYTWAQYLAQSQQWQQGIDSATNNAFGIMWPSMGAETNWIPQAEAALLAEAALTSGAMTPSIVSQHSYLGGLTQGSGAAWPADYLLQPIATTEFPQAYAGFAAVSHQAGSLFRIGEANSFFNGGVSGISNTFQSSLWSIDLMFNYLIDGMDGINWHTGQYTPYELFQFKPQTANGITTFSLTEVNPLYYGLLVFSEMAGNNAQLLPVSTTTSANVSIWATVDSTLTTHVIVLNKDEQATGDVQITLPGYTTGTVRYLSAANYASTLGVTWGGQTFDGSPDGTLQGQLATTTITANNQVFTIPNIPITSAVEIDFANTGSRSNPKNPRK